MLEDGILGELREQTKWLRLLGFQALKTALEQMLRNDKQRLAYEYTDGKRTSREVAALAGIGAGTVSALWNEWIALGVATESANRPGRAEHLASLSQLGIELPESTPPRRRRARSSSEETAQEPGPDTSTTDMFTQDEAAIDEQ
jgi:hypothetical protein